MIRLFSSIYCAMRYYHRYDTLESTSLVFACHFSPRPRSDHLRHDISKDLGFADTRCKADPGHPLIKDNELRLEEDITEDREADACVGLQASEAC